MLELYVLPSEGDSFVVPLAGESIVIGRSAQCDLTIADPSLSRRHARLFRQRDRWMIEDLESHNGTLVNEREVTAARALAIGDVIQVSATRIEIRDSHAGGSAITAEGGLPEHTLLLSADELLAHHRSLESLDRDSLEDLRQHGDRLRLLNDVHDALARFVELPELLELILARVFEELEPEEGIILLKGPDGGFELAAHRTSGPGVERSRISETLVREVAVKGQAALVLDTAIDDRFSAADSLFAAGVRSLIAAPLQDPGGPLGMIALSSRLHLRQFGEQDLELLASLASVAALRIRNLALAEEAAERRRLESELKLARQIQISLLPDRLPQPPGYVLHGMTVPSRGVSGDFYEVIERGGLAECVLVVADVSGKGIAAALLMASVEALLIEPTEEGHATDEICRRVNRRLCLRTPPAKFATAFLATLDAASGRLRYTNAGHNPALVVRASQDVDRLETTSMPLGLFPEADFLLEECSLGEGDTVVIYTDGITEATNAQGEEYGIDRLIASCRALHDAPVEELVREIERDLGDFVADVPFADDRTVLAARRLPRPDR